VYLIDHMLQLTTEICIARFADLLPSNNVTSFNMARTENDAIGYSSTPATRTQYQSKLLSRCGLIFCGAFIKN